MTSPNRKLHTSSGGLVLVPIEAHHLEFARRLRNDNADSFFSSQQVPPDMHSLWFNELQNNPFKQFFIIEDNGQPVGTISVWSSDQSRWQIGNLCIDSQHRRKEHAFHAVKAIANHFRRNFVARVKPDNTASQSLFLKAGFRKDQQTGNFILDQGWYSNLDGCSAVLQFMQAKVRRVIVIGDLIIDRDIIGTAARVSQDAPVPVISDVKESFSLGGAGAVAAMCTELGAVVSLITDYGNDQNVRLLCERHHLSGYRATSRQTATKTRISAVSSGGIRQTVARYDRDACQPIDRYDRDAMIGDLEKALGFEPDLILIADYGKGVVTPEMLDRLSPHERAITIVDPIDGRWRSRYAGVACIVPNRYEGPDPAVADVLRRSTVSAVVSKRDAEGCSVAWYDGRSTYCQVAREATCKTAINVAGAGDQFLAALGMSWVNGASWPLAAEIANVAAGIKVSRHDRQPVTLRELRGELERLGLIYFQPGPDGPECSIG